MLLCIEQILTVYTISYIEINNNNLLNAKYVHQTCLGLTCVKFQNADKASAKHGILYNPYNPGLCKQIG